MGFSDIINYVAYDNPISKSAITILTGKKGLSSSTISTIPTKIEVVPLWKLAAEHGPYIKIAGLMGATAVALGAYGAHKSYPKDRAEELKRIFDTANRLHFFHSLALLGVPMCKNPKITGSLLLSGTILFSGTLYYNAFTGDHSLSKLAPIGGTILIVGWLSMVF